MRLDQYLIEKQICETRNKAQEMIKNNCILINNKIVNKNNYLVKNTDIIDVIKENQALKFVSRAGLKLKKALEAFKIDLKNKVVLDIGSSTGGFIDCALQNGAKFIFGIDVGENQLHNSLKEKNNIQVFEKTNVKNIFEIKEKFIYPIDVITCDVSFISLKNVFSAIDFLVNKKTILLFLIKPQFELSDKIIKQNNYCIKSEKLHNEAINNVIGYAKANNLKLINLVESPIKGAKKENKEFIAWFQKDL